MLERWLLDRERFGFWVLEGETQKLYAELYCARGEMENRIKELQLGSFAHRTICRGWWANQFPLLFSCAHVLMERIQALGLAGTEPRAGVSNTIRLKLLKIGAVVLRRTGGCGCC